MSDASTSRHRLLNEVGVAAVATDPAGVVTVWTMQAAALLGLPAEVALGRSMAEVREERDAVLAPLAEALREPPPAEREIGISRADGTEAFAVVRTTPGADGGVNAVLVEVTPRKRQERRLQAQYAAARVLAEAEDVDEATPQLLREVGEAIGWQAGDLWVADEDERVLHFVDAWFAPGLDHEAYLRDARTRVFRAGEVLPGRVWERAEPIWVADVPRERSFSRAGLLADLGLRAAFSFPVRVGAHVLGVMEFFRDRPTEPDRLLLEAMDAVGSQFGQFIQRAGAAAAVRESEIRKTAVVDSALDAIVSLDHHGIVTEWNPAAERTFGYGRGEAVGHELAELIVPEHLRERHRRGLARHVQTGETTIIGRQVEMVAHRKDGTLIPVDLTITRVDLPGPPAFTGYLRDITQQKGAEAALLEGQQRLRQALEAGSMGVWDWDIEADTVSWSSTLEELHGLEPGTFEGTFEAFESRVHPDDRERVVAVVRAAIERDETVEVEYRILRPDGEPCWLQARGEVRRDLEGRPRRLVGVCTDVTGRREAEEIRARLLDGERAARAQAEEARHRLEFLAEASRIFGSSLNLDKTLAKVARLAVPQIADWCSVDIPEGNTVRQVALAHSDPAKVALAKSLRERYPPDLDAPGGLAEVLRSGRPILYPEMSEQMIREAAQDEEHYEILKGLGLRSAMVVPLVARGRTLGSISFVTGESGRTFDQSDLSLAQELADRAAVAVDNARLYEERSYIARTLQRSLLPAALPEIPGVEVAARYRPLGEGNQVGGDFYDLFERAPGDWVVLVGDVQGKGPDAAALTGLARHTLRAAAMREIQPSRALAMLNDAILAEEVERFATVALGRLVPEDGHVTLTVSCGGHPLPHVIRADGTIEEVGKHGTLLGLFPDVELHDETIRLGSGDAVVLYTDGVIEDRRVRTEGETRRVRDLLARCALDSAEAVAEGLDREALRMHDGGPQDDVAILVLRVR